MLTETNTDHDMPEMNILGWTLQHPYRRKLLRFCGWWWTDKIFLSVTVADNIVDILGKELSWSSIPVTDILFASVYLIEIVIKSLAYGFFGGRLSYYNRSLFNRIDILVMV